jgi:N-acetylmuramoyl-L-alanine amidase
MTRTTDVFDNVHEKARKANAFGGDLFISIHCNYTSGTRHTEIVGHTTKTVGKGKKRHTIQVPEYHSYTVAAAAKGTETYIWGVDKNEDKTKALLENEWLYKDSSLSEDLKGFNAQDPEQIALISLKQQQYAERSRILASTVEDEFVKVGRASRETKQRGKGIWVLQATAMPAILIETGFISNPEEEDYLKSKQGQKEIAECVTRAVKRYKTALDNKIQINQSKPR